MATTNPYRPPSSTPKWTLLFVKILFILLLLLLLPKLVDGSSSRTKRKTTKKTIQAIRSHCRDHVCTSSLEESLNCVNLCLSPACYQVIYSHMPLEDGEIDLTRDKAFEACVADEFKLVERRRRRER